MLDHPSETAQRRDAARAEEDGARSGAETADRRGDAPSRHAAPPDGAEEPDKGDRNKRLRAFIRRRPLLMLGLAVALIAAIIAAVIWWRHARQFESTDDAFIDTRIVPISTQVAGAIAAVAVTDNQRVATGAVLARIDDRDYRIAVDQAKAQVAQAQASIANLGAQIDAEAARIDEAQKQVAEAQAALTFSEDENNRAQELLTRGAGTQQRAQQTASDLRQKQAALSGAKAAEVAAEKQIPILEAQKEAAQAQLAQAQAQQRQAEINLDRTVITAPVDGRVAKLSAASGVYAPVGQALMTLVPGTVWITANYKETQLALMRPGQPVDIEIDAYPDHPLHGHVDSLQAGSGPAFSLLPPENATGNFVKVVQRVPVKIVFDQEPDVLLGPGMSVVPTVKVR